MVPRSSDPYVARIPGAHPLRALTLHDHQKAALGRRGEVRRARPPARFSPAELQVLAVPGIDPQHGLLFIVSVPEPKVDLHRVLGRVQFDRSLLFDTAVIRDTERFAVELELMITDLFQFLA